jgi:hypothetical protein
MLQASAAAVIVPLSFGDDKNSPSQNQSMTLSADVTGDVLLGGNGTVFNAVSKKLENFVFTPPLSHELEISPDWRPITVGIRSERGFPGDPPGRGGFAEVSHVGTNLTLLDLTGVKLRMNTFMIAVPIDTIVVTSNSNVSILKALTLDLNLNDTDVGFNFAQLGSAIVSGTNGQGDFSLTGNLQSLFHYDAIIGGIFPTPFMHGPDNVPAILDGSWTITQVGQKHKLALDGTLQFLVGYSYSDFSTSVSISDPLALTLSITGDLAFSFMFTASVHLEQTFPAPEPGSIVLLGIGLAAMAAVAIGRRKRPGRCS